MGMFWAFGKGLEYSILHKKELHRRVWVGLVEHRHISGSYRAYVLGFKVYGPKTLLRIRGDQMDNLMEEWT